MNWGLLALFILALGALLADWYFNLRSD